jgi:peptidoglycan/LPS O-acetylase OafA/YrhL
MLGRFFANPVARFTAYVGAYSYSIYIWHLSLARHQAAVLGASPRLAHMNHLAHFFLLTFFYLAMAIGIGVILGNLIEFPALAVRDRLFPSRTGALQGYAKPAASVGAG